MSPSTRGQVGVAIPLNMKSVGLALARGVAWVTFVFSTVYVMGASDGSDSESQPEDPSGSILQTVMLVSLMLALYLQFSKKTKHASYDRAIELCSHFNPDIRPIMERSVNEHFNKVESGRVPVENAMEVEDDYECTNKMLPKGGNANDTDQDIV